MLSSMLLRGFQAGDLGRSAVVLRRPCAKSTLCRSARSAGLRLRLHFLAQGLSARALGQEGRHRPWRLSPSAVPAVVAPRLGAARVPLACLVRDLGLESLDAVAALSAIAA